MPQNNAADEQGKSGLQIKKKKKLEATLKQLEEKF